MGFHKKILVWEKAAIILDIQSSDANESNYIKSIFSDWAGIKARVLEIVKKMEMTWKKERVSDEGDKFFG